MRRPYYGEVAIVQSGIEAEKKKKVEGGMENIQMRGGKSV